MGFGEDLRAHGSIRLVEALLKTLTRAYNLHSEAKLCKQYTKNIENQGLGKVCPKSYIRIPIYSL